MNLPAEDTPPPDTESEEKEESSETAQPEAQTESSNPAEKITEDAESAPTPLEIGYEYQERGLLTGVREHLQSMTMLRDDLFLSILAITLLNAVIFLYYTTSPEVGVALKEANQELRSELGRESDLLNPISDFINVHGDFNNPEHGEFNTSLARFRNRISRLGVESSDLFFLDEFVRKNGGLYWSKKSDRAPTEYQPRAPHVE